MQPAGGIDDHQVLAAGARRLDGVEGHRSRVSPGLVCHHLDLCPLSPEPELLDGGRTKLVVHIPRMRSDLPQSSIGRKERDPCRVEARPLGSHVDVPAVPRYAPVRHGRDERGGAERRLLWSAPGTRRPGAADPPHALVTSHAPDHEGHRRHQMHMAVRVPREREDPPGTRQSRLGADLAGELARADAAAEKPLGELDDPNKPPLLFVDEAPDRRRVAHRPPADEVDVQTDLKVRLHPRQCGRLGGRVGGHDERGRADDALAERLQDALGDTWGEAEIVRGDHEVHLLYTPRIALRRMTKRSRSIFGVSARKSMRVSPCCRSANGISRTV